jgi:hypothetical protein
MYRGLAGGYKCLVDRCVQCGASLGEGHRFRRNCGAAAGGCPSCGEPVIAGSRFCHECAAHDLADTAATTELLAQLDRYRPGRLAPLRRAERDLARAAFTVAIAGLRRHSTPYHLAHGLLDHAQHLLRTGDDDAAEAAISEFRSIAERLGCQPLLDRAGTIQPARPRTAAS